MNNKQSYGFQVKFDSSDQSINTETYIQALISFTTAMKEINYQLGGGEKISINVKAQEPGSFKVSLLLKAAESLFSKDSVSYLKDIVAVIAGIVTLKKIRKQMDHKKTEINGDDVMIKNNNGSVIYQTNKNTYNIYNNNQIVQDAISENFRSLERDSDVNGFEIKYDQKTIQIDKKEFPELAEKLEVQVQDKEDVNLPVNLVIVKLVFQGKNRKWDFLYNGAKISATIIDKNFWKEIDQGKSFSKGDELVADLRIIREYDSEVAAYINKDYQVVNVREHHPRESRKQISIDSILEE